MNKKNYTVEEAIQIVIIEMFIEQILKVGKERVLKFVEAKSDPEQRIKHRKFYLRALDVLETRRKDHKEDMR